MLFLVYNPGSEIRGDAKNDYRSDEMQTQAAPEQEHPQPSMSSSQGQREKQLTYGQGQHCHVTLSTLGRVNMRRLVPPLTLPWVSW